MAKGLSSYFKINKTDNGYVITDENIEGAIKKYINRIESGKNKEGKTVYYIQADDGNNLVFSQDLNKEIIKALKSKEQSSNDRDFNDIFNKLGKCSALRSINNITGFIGKDPKAQDIMKSLDDVDMDDVYNLAFQNIKGIEKDTFSGKTPNQIIDICARINAVNSLKNDKKIDDETYNALVKSDTDDVNQKYTESIKTNSVTRNKFEAFKNKYTDEFEDGFNEFQKIIKEGDKEKLKELKEPFTNKQIPSTEWKKLSGSINVAGKIISTVGKQIGNILDISENSPDIYSKMIFLMIGGGKKLLKNVQKQAALKRFANYKKITVKGFRKTVNDSLEVIKKNGLIKKANSEAK